MVKIIYKILKSFDSEAIMNLYNDAGWSAYTDYPLNLINAIQSSLCVLSAWDEEKLVGLIRIVGDGLTIIYIQDILVLKEYKRKNIGSTLMKMALEKYENVRQTVLLTDDNNETRGFYEALGFKACDKGQLVSFVKLKQD